MGVNWDTIEDGLRAWAIDALGLPDDRVRIANHVGPRPPVKPYATLIVSSVQGIGRDDYALPAIAGGVGVRRGVREATIRLQVYGPGSFNLANQAHGALEDHRGQALLRAGAMSYMRDEGVLDLTELVDTSREERAALDFTVALTDERADRMEDDATTIDAVAVSSEYPNNDPSLSEADDIIGTPAAP